jgi:hypothetical protein
MIDTLTAEAVRTAMKDPSHLREWLEASGRRWLVFDALDLVEALPWPAGVEALIEIINCYRDHRRCQPSGRVRVEETDVLGKVEVPVMKSDQLEIEELDRCIRYLIGLASNRDPKWSLERPPQ